MDVNDKMSKISQSMKDFNEFISETIKELDKNLSTINKQIENHHDFINFIQIMNLYESYKWNNIKYEYNLISKKVNKDKHIIHAITKNLSFLTNYYTQPQIININQQIKEIDDKIELMIYNFNNLKNIHKDTIYKKRHLINPKTIRVNSINNQNEKILVKIYENYMSIKLLNTQMKYLQNIKKKIMIKINQPHLI
jgi:hypothetical protein